MPSTPTHPITAQAFTAPPPCQHHQGKPNPHYKSSPTTQYYPVSMAHEHKYRAKTRHKLLLSVYKSPLASATPHY
ncbi:hypothetical protein THIOM_000538 [Candidatus Thiomargarita nelsonii]|uniref:Uncharacterized protein n=1 Tax=Candidatus Thiomargarita nelsonii TaxID=1003181 RepID=A0A176S6T0_9GAMM|nr:hypothetical protein THIOM_000538 [Candidatus Thiomargarita nelsonii]